MWFWILILPGVAAAYFIFLRPVLAAMPKLQKFYAEADGFWAKISALGWHSASIAWGYFMAFVGLVMAWIEPLGAAVGDPDIKNQVINSLQTNPKVLAYGMMVISAITIAARLRSITKAP
jgi:hypothetical protein